MPGRVGSALSEIMKVQLEGTLACAVSPEGKKASMPIASLLGSAQGSHPPVIFPHGVRAAFARGPYIIWVHETPPEVHNFKWISENSALKYGPHAEYETVTIALPFVLILAVFIPGPGGLLMVSQSNECYFLTKPLESCDDPLLFPALLNVSRYKQPEGRPLAWICTQNINHASYAPEKDFNARIRGAFDALHHEMFDKAHNLSSEVHEGTSYYTLSQGVDKRVATIEAWQKATAEDDAFVLGVPWLKSGFTLGQIVERTFTNLRAPKGTLDSTDAIARIIFNYQPSLPGFFL